MKPQDNYTKYTITDNILTCSLYVYFRFRMWWADSTVALVCLKWNVHYSHYIPNFCYICEKSAELCCENFHSQNFIQSSHKLVPILGILQVSSQTLLLQLLRFSNIVF